MSSFSEDYSGVSEKELSVDNDDENETHAIEFYGINRNNDQAKINKSQRLYSECDEYQDLETVDEQDHEDEI